MTTWSHALAVAALATALACSPARRSADAPLTIEPIDFALPAGSALPHISAFREPAILSWVETAVLPSGGTRATLKFAARTPTGWTAPRDVATGTDWFVNPADVPSVVRLDARTLVAHWLQTTDERREAYDIKMSWSKDDGVTWTAPASPHHDGTTTQHGFATLFPMPGGGLGMVWLDGRATADPENDNMSVRAAAFDADGRQLSESLVDDRVCDCCPTSIAIAGAGPIAVYRDRSPTEVRDIAVARLVNGTWTPPAVVHADDWKIEACPVNGPAASASGRNVAVAWMTAAGGEGHAFAAFSTDDGVSFGAPIRLDDVSSLGRVGIVLVDSSTAIATWIEAGDGNSQLRVRRIDRASRRGASQSVTAAGAERATGYPGIARSGNELLFAWTETANGQPRVRTAAARGL